jgi:TatD DNase family protein
MKFIDTHIHLDDARYDEGLQALLDRSEEAGVFAWIIPAADIKDLPKAAQISTKYANCYFAIGVHPNNAKDYDEETLLQYASHPKCVAIGECGLDYYYLTKENEAEQKALQKKVFIAHINLAKKLNKPLIVHVRDASQDARELMLSENADEIGGVFHCYNADEMLLCFKNFYYGIGGVVTFNNAKKLVGVLPKIPLDRLLLETDGPYLTPMPHRGTTNEPSYIPLIAKKCADILHLAQTRVAEITTENAQTLFSLAP